MRWMRRCVEPVLWGGCTGSALHLGWILLLTLNLSIAHANVIIDLAYIGDAGNAADDTGHGAVGYDYYIGTYEVTVAQYTEFLNAVAQSDPNGLYHSSMATAPFGGAFIIRSGTDGSYSYTAVSGKENQPVRWVSFFDAMRFSNWMANGQGSGDTETGSYNLTLGDPTFAVREPGATWAIPTQDEWYKAAYYSASNALYYNYPNGTDSVPAEPTDETTPRIFNFGDLPFWQGGVVFTSTGETTGQSSYGTFDQGGNVREWTETFGDPPINQIRVMRGGFFSSSEGFLSANSFGEPGPPSTDDGGGAFGWRTSSPNPRPCCCCCWGFPFYGSIAGGSIREIPPLLHKLLPSRGYGTTGWRTGCVLCG